MGTEPRGTRFPKRSQAARRAGQSVSARSHAASASGPASGPSSAPGSRCSSTARTLSTPPCRGGARAVTYVETRPFVGMQDPRRTHLAGPARGRQGRFGCWRSGFTRTCGLRERVEPHVLGGSGGGKNERQQGRVRWGPAARRTPRAARRSRRGPAPWPRVRLVRGEGRGVSN